MSPFYFLTFLFFTVVNVISECTPGKFGVDCLQDCHCAGGMPCDAFTGTSEGDCEDGWLGEGCQGKSILFGGLAGISKGGGHPPENLKKCTNKNVCQTLTKDCKTLLGSGGPKSASFRLLKCKNHLARSLRSLA